MCFFEWKSIHPFVRHSLKPQHLRIIVNWIINIVGKPFTMLINGTL